MATAAVFSASARRLLSTVADGAGAGSAAELPVSIGHLRSLARAGRLADIDAALAPHLASHSVAAVSALSSVGLPDRASALLATIRNPTAAHLNALLAPLLRRHRLVGLVPTLLAAHPSVPRDDATEGIHAKALCIATGADSALHLLQRESPPPSLQLFTSVIDSYYKQRKPHRAEQLWREMVEDHGIVPDAAAHNVRITYKAATGTVEEVKELIRAMREDAGLQPDIVSHNGLMRAMARHGRVDKMMEVYKRLEKGSASAAAEGKSAPDCATYTCVVAALCKAGRWSEADDVFYEAVKRRKLADLGTARVLVRGLKEAGKGRAARRVVIGLRKKFPDRFDGPWKDLEELAGIAGEDEEGDVEGEDDEQPPATTTTTAALNTSPILELGTDWEINGIDRSGLDAQVAEAYSANLVQIASPRTLRPVLVLTPVTADEVRAYVVCCRDHGLTVRARSGGHDYEGLSYCSLRPSGDGEGAARFAVVDVAALQAVRVDAARGVARTKAGATRAVCRIGAAGLPPPPPVSSGSRS
uniref:FAD-binding PCMH-type domain-containing protein n=1 Tax=Oryza nivara TaxID=4536 RepID=A0A0E0FPK7_ORYNI